jgi:lipid A disaccharide synthetase
MLTDCVKRCFSSSNLNKTVCILANSKQADLIGAKIMQHLKEVSGHDDINFFGYGGQWMKKEGMAGNIDLDIN